MQVKVHSIQIYIIESFCIFIAQLLKSKYLQFKSVPRTEIKMLENQWTIILLLHIAHIWYETN
jgi:hypothetical protein